MRTLIDAPIPYSCFKGHVVVKHPSENKKCAHCEGFTVEELKEAFRNTNVVNTLGKKAIVAYSGKLYPVELADIVNGAVPGVDIPKDGWFLYYMSMIVDGRTLYKVGISQKPHERLKELAPTILHLEFYPTQSAAFAAEQRILRLYSSRKINIVIPKLRRKGATEFFKDNVLQK